MRKREEVNDPQSCLNRAAPDELVFVLRGHDVCAPAVVRLWAELRIAKGKNERDDAQIREARTLADRMERERGYPPTPRPTIDTTNRFLIGRNAAGLTFLKQPHPMAPDDALIVAAYLVALAPDASFTFADALAAVQNA